MITLITTSLSIMPQFDNPIFDIPIIIIFILIIASCCFGDDTKPKTRSAYKPARNNRNHGFSNDYPDYSDYDPSWDDAWFEKTGQDPWFDDNPDDHKK